jgi:hypothetical protein
VGNIDGTGPLEIIAAPGPGLASPLVRVFTSPTGTPLEGPLGSFNAYAADFAGGVFVSAGDVNRDARDDIITGADAGAGPHVKVFNGIDGSELASFFAFDTSFTGGVRVASGDVNRDGQAEVLVAAGPGAGPHVKAFAIGEHPLGVASFFAYDPAFAGGVFVSGDFFNATGSPLARAAVDQVVSDADDPQAWLADLYAGAALWSLSDDEAESTDRLLSESS